MVYKADVDSQWLNAILTPDQVAEELSLRVDTVRDLMRRRIFPAAKSWISSVLDLGPQPG